MRHVRKGKFSRDLMPSMLRPFAPLEALHGLNEVSLQALKEGGKKLILLDVDNTLIPWKSYAVPESTTRWLAEAKGHGFELCVLSNTRHPTRLQAVCKDMGLDFIRGRFKPSRRMYVQALTKHQCSPKEAVMIGDQLFTDVLGANRSGIDAVWLRPMPGKEFVGTTLISRNLERALGTFLYRYFQPHQGSPEEAGVFHSGIVVSFIKFAGVGVVSTLVDVGLHSVLMYHTPLREIVGTWVIQNILHGVDLSDGALTSAAFGPLKVVPVCLAISTSYFLNRAMTTFTGQAKEASVKEGAKFFIIAGIAALFNIGVASSVAAAIPGAKFAIGTLCGMVVGTLVNFNGQRLWTFAAKGKKE